MSKKEQRSTILVGGDTELLAFYSRMKHQNRVLGVFCQYGVLLPEGLRRVGDVCDAALFLSEHSGVRKVYCGVATLTLNDVRIVQEECKVRAVKFCAVMPMLNDLNADFVVAKMDGSTVLVTKREALTRFPNRMLKRFFDMVVIIVFMLTLFPFVYVVKAILVKRKSPGSSFCTRLCVGVNGHRFKRICFKGEQRSLASVFNVLKGDMSLVGPTYFDLSDEEETGTLPKHLERRYVKSGMTGWSQVKKTEAGSREQLDADVWYVEHWSLWLDIRILLKSIFV